MVDRERPPLELVTGPNAKRFDFESAISAVTRQSLERIEAMQHGEAFGLLAAALREMERHSPDLVSSDKFQRVARRALKDVWDAFVRDVKDRKKFTARLAAKSQETDVLIIKAGIGSPAANKPLSVDQIKYLAALRAQSKEAVVVFPNDQSRSAALQRSTEAWSASFGAVYQEAYDVEFRFISDMAAMYNTILPMIKGQIEGCVRPMLKGERGANSYLPVTGDTVDVNISAFLNEAPKFATTLGGLSFKRNRTNDI